MRSFKGRTDGGRVIVETWVQKNIEKVKNIFILLLIFCHLYDILSKMLRFYC